MRRSLAVVGLVVLIGADNAPTSQRPPIAGIWRFEREVDRRADGTTVSLGPDQGYEGMVILTPDGFMSGTLMPKGRKWAIGTASLAELRETVEMGTAYSGRYIVDPATQTIAINVVTSLDPADVGKRLTRHFVFGKEGALTLSGTWAYRGETYGFAITFSRME
jgi:lipocalin-like protein